ncbi:hypothetical protein CXB51_025457 [Gossypium anomalum]|uniref:Seven-in-absentia protein TRAF-like domain-containing protein n=1 Tax=Gossypium anomalum TaxID=47600 RepID=A0A8J5YE14_9ROSI|nr:hypothetical protein CXB51_025457 [Gossypium anomalum]
MASGNPFFDDLRSKPEVIDLPQNEDRLDSESVNEPTQTATKPNLIVSSNVRELLECPVCLNAMYPPIHQCLNGHTRCVLVASQECTIGAPHAGMSLGILDVLHWRRSLHLLSFPVNIKVMECTVVGDIPFLVAHLKDDHKVDMHSGSTFNHRYVKSNPHEVENATWMLTVFSCFGQYFCLHFEAFQLGMAPVYIAFLRFMGDDNEAKNYSYSLEVGGNGRKLIWQGVPRSIRDSHRKVRDSFDGLIIQRNMALFFSGGDRKELKLRVTGRIWKEQ